MVRHEIFPTHKHGYRKGGKNFISAKKGYFLSFECGENQISPLLYPIQKRLETSTSAPPGKYPSGAHAHKHVKLHHFCKKCVVLHHLAILFNNTNAV